MIPIDQSIPPFIYLTIFYELFCFCSFETSTNAQRIRLGAPNFVLTTMVALRAHVTAAINCKATERLV